NAASIIAAAGCQGRFIKTVVGADDTYSGGNSKSPTENPSFRSLHVTGLNSIQSAFAPTGELRKLNDEQLRNLNRSISDLSRAQLEALGLRPETSDDAKAIQDAFGSIAGFGSAIPELNPQNNYN